MEATRALTLVAGNKLLGSALILKNKAARPSLIQLKSLLTLIKTTKLS